MKKIYIFGMIACVLVLSVPALSHAEETTVDADAPVSAEVSAPTRSKPLDIKDRIRENAGLRPENRKDIRGMASTTRMEKKEIKDARSENRKDIRGMASTTRMEKKEIKDARGERKIMRNSASSSIERKENRKNVRIEIFQAHQKRLVAQLELALTNLSQIRARIISRIEKLEAETKDMSEARRLIAVSDTKITLAVQEIATLASYIPAGTVITVGTTTESTQIDLVKPRQIGENAIKAVREVHRSLVDVIITIAHTIRTKANERATTTTQ